MRSEKDFCIPDEVRLKFPDLVKLIVETESMDDNEKQYWFDILPSMTEKQVDDFFMMLETERVKMQELEEKYKEEIKVLNEGWRIEWTDWKKKKPVPREIKDLEKHVEEGNAIISEIEKSRK